MPLGGGSGSLGGGTLGAGSAAPASTAVFVVQQGTLKVYINGVLDDAAFMAEWEHGTDQRYGRATVYRTGGGTTTPDITYWDEVEIVAGNSPTSLYTRFKGWVIPVEDQMYPFQDRLICRGKLYRAEWVRNNSPGDLLLNEAGGTDMAMVELTGTLTKTAGSTTVTGTGTAFTTEVAVNDYLNIGNDAANSVETKRHKVASIASDTSLEVDVAFELAGTGKSGAIYGRTDENMVTLALQRAGCVPGSILGTGTIMGIVCAPIDWASKGPFTCQDGESWLSFIERVDEISVSEDSAGGVNVGRYRTIERRNGDIDRVFFTPKPQEDSAAVYTFTEGIDLLELRISRDPTDAANRIVVTGGQDITGEIFTFTVSSAFAPYLPSGTPNGPDGYPEVTYSWGSPMLEKNTLAEPDPGKSCQELADMELASRNTVVDLAEATTPRDDPVSVGNVVYLKSPTANVDRRFWVMNLSGYCRDGGEFIQHMICEARS